MSFPRERPLPQTALPLLWRTTCKAILRRPALLGPVAIVVIATFLLEWARLRLSVAMLTRLNAVHSVLGPMPQSLHLPSSPAAVLLLGLPVLVLSFLTLLLYEAALIVTAAMSAGDKLRLAWHRMLFESRTVRFWQVYVVCYAGNLLLLLLGSALLISVLQHSISMAVAVLATTAYAAIACVLARPVLLLLRVNVAQEAVIAFRATACVAIVARVMLEELIRWQLPELLQSLPRVHWLVLMLANLIPQLALVWLFVATGELVRDAAPAGPTRVNGA